MTDLSNPTTSYSRGDVTFIVLNVVLGGASLIVDSVLPLIGGLLLCLFAVFGKPWLAIIASIPLLMTPIVVEIEGVSVVYAGMAVLSGMALLKRVSHLRRVRKLLGVTFVLLALLVISILRTPERDVVSESAAISGLLSLIVCIAMAVAAAVTGMPRRLLIRTLAIVGVMNSGFLLVNSQGTGSGRIASDFLNANGVGYISAISLISVILLARDERRWMWLALAIVPAATLFAAQSRGSIVIVGLGLGVAAFVFMKGWARVPVAILSVALGIWLGNGGAESLVSSLFPSREFGGVASSADTRIGLIDIAIELVGSHFWLGVGYRAFPDYSLDRVGFGYNTHNDYVRIAVEVGVPALIALLALIVLPFLLTAARTEYRGFILGVAAGSMAAPFFANILHQPMIMLPLWLLVGARWEDLSIRWTSPTPEESQQFGPGQASRFPAVRG